MSLQVAPYDNQSRDLGYQEPHELDCISLPRFTIPSEFATAKSLQHLDLSLNRFGSQTRGRTPSTRTRARNVTFSLPQNFQGKCYASHNCLNCWDLHICILCMYKSIKPTPYLCGDQAWTNRNKLSIQAKQRALMLWCGSPPMHSDVACHVKAERIFIAVSSV